MTVSVLLAVFALLLSPISSISPKCYGPCRSLNSSLTDLESFVDDLFGYRPCEVTEEYIEIMFCYSNEYECFITEIVVEYQGRNETINTRGCRADVGKEECSNMTNAMRGSDLFSHVGTCKMTTCNETKCNDEYASTTVLNDPGSDAARRTWGPLIILASANIVAKMLS